MPNDDCSLPALTDDESRWALMTRLRGLAGLFSLSAMICVQALMLLPSEHCFAGSANSWDGTYLGLINSGAFGSHCVAWAIEPHGEGTSRIGRDSCTGGTGLVGVHFGENFQAHRFLWGFEPSFSLSGGSSQHDDVRAASEASLPAGDYAFSGHLRPSSIAAIAGRLGYAGSEWTVYVKGGPAFGLGSRRDLVSYTPAGAPKATLSFDAGEGFDRVGWLAGAGLEMGLYGPWSIGLDVERLVLGGGAVTASGCSGPSDVCSAVAGQHLVATRERLQTSLVQLSVTYYFDYW